MALFGASKVITQSINETDLSTYFVGFDLAESGCNEYRWKSLIQLLIKVIPEFSFGFHHGEETNNTEVVQMVCESANAIYKIDEFKKVKDIYDKGECIPDDVSDKYLRRGEFGELILHLLLRDYYNTIPMISKIYFKDSYGHTVHGFDAVHIQPDNKSLWLGESKLYQDGKKGIKALIEDIKEHFCQDYLNNEFSIVSKKLKFVDSIPQKDYWLDLLDNSTKLSDQLTSITIPLLCTYTSDNFSKFNNEELDDFIEAYEKEMRELKAYFDSKYQHNWKTNLNVVLLLFPVKCKKELVRRLHGKLSLMQQIGE